jgi:hypothetical protein
MADASVKHDIAILDVEGVISQIKSVSEEEWVTDQARRRVKLDQFHDMGNKEGQYQYNWSSGQFLPIKRKFTVFDDERNVIAALVEAIVSIVQVNDQLEPDEQKKFKTHISAAAKHILKTWL